jgi:hypothetical protein
MLTITGAKLTDEQVTQTMQCLSVDRASIISTTLMSDGPVTIQECRCQGEVAYVLYFKPADDMVMPVPLCLVHFNAIRISLVHDDNKIAIDSELFK